jgi:flagellar export protein FliJ
MIRLDDEERFARTALTVMVNEEEAAERAWLLRRKELRSIELLREKDLTEWAYEQDRTEQAALDEWAVMRRAA